MARVDPSPLFRFLFRDAARPVELLLAANLVAWAWSLMMQPQIFERDSYAAFASAPTWAWASLFAMTASLILYASFTTRSLRPVLRPIAMTASAFCWALVAISFVSAGVGTTANANYTLLTAFSVLAGGYLSWKET